METLKKTRRRRSKPLPPVDIREMELRDVPAVFELGQKLFTAEKWPTLYWSWDDHELAQLFSTDAETCPVAEADKRIVGLRLAASCKSRAALGDTGGCSGRESNVVSNATALLRACYGS